MNRPCPDLSRTDPLRDWRKAVAARAVAGVTGKHLPGWAGDILHKAAVAPADTATPAWAGNLASTRTGAFLRSLRPRSAAAQLLDQEPLLAGFCSHASAAEFIFKLIEKRRPADLLGDRDKLRCYSRLLGMRVRETSAMSALATKMRLTQQAQIQPRSAGRTWDANNSGPKLWDRKPPWDDH